jgi:hypothetical protein
VRDRKETKYRLVVHHATGPGTSVAVLAAVPDRKVAPAKAAVVATSRSPAQAVVGVATIAARLLALSLVAPAPAAIPDGAAIRVAAERQTKAATVVAAVV